MNTFDPNSSVPPGTDPWDQRYAADSYFYGTEPNDYLRQQVAAIPAGGSVLCLGEGEGRNAVYLAMHGYRVVALDRSAVGLAKTRRLAASKGVMIDTVTADLQSYQMDPALWDGVVSIWCHLPSSPRAAVHRQVVGALKPKGVFLLEAYTPDQISHGTGGPKDRDMLPTLADLRRELDGLDFVHAVECERVVREGSGHTGMSAVVQIVAKRGD